MPILVEYLVIIKKPGSFCDTVSAFATLLQTDSRIKLAGETVRFNNEQICTLRMTTGNLDPVSDSVDRVQVGELLKAVRVGMDRIGGEVEQLRNDISSHLARQAYPLVQEVENTMRRLITNFMMVNVGLDWADEALPPKVGESVERSKAREAADEHTDKENLHVLYKLNFDQLGNVLFDARTQRSVAELYAFLEKEGEIDRTELEQFLPRSNWDRYFAKVIDCEDKFLKTRWEKMYRLRCKVAHNRMITEADLENTKKLVGEVLPKLQSALANLPQVAVPPAEAEAVAESAASNTSAIVGQFILRWQELEGAIASRLIGPEFNKRLILSGGQLKTLGFLEGTDVDKYEAVRALRNQTVHGRGVPIDEARLSDAVGEMVDLQWWIEIESFVDRLRAMKKEQRDEVIGDLFGQSSYQIIHSEEFSSAIAETNATEFDFANVEIDQIGFDEEDRTCVVFSNLSRAGSNRTKSPGVAISSLALAKLGLTLAAK
jgi:hypothetical protein